MKQDSCDTDFQEALQQPYNTSILGKEQNGGERVGIYMSMKDTNSKSNLTSQSPIHWLPQKLHYQN